MKHLPYIIDQNGIHEDIQVAFVIENDVRTYNGPRKVAFLRKSVTPHLVNMLPTKLAMATIPKS